MMHSVRSAETEHAYNKRWLLGLLSLLLLLNVLAAAWMMAMGDRLPDPLATHWNAKNQVDGWTSLGGSVLTMVLSSLGVGALISGLAIAMRGQNTLLARIGVAAGVAFGVGLAALMVALVAGQIDLADTSSATMSGPVMAAGLALAAVLAGLVLWLYRPGEVDSTPNPLVAAMAAELAADSELARAAGYGAAQGQALRIKVSMGRLMWLWSLGSGAVVALSTFFVNPWLALAGLPAAAIAWIFCSGTAVIDPAGVRVLAGGFWKLMPLTWQEITTASVQDIKAMDYGGWGYRMTGEAVGFITGNGPALVLEAGFHQKFVISMPGVETAGRAAALANAYVNVNKVKK